MRRGHDVLRGVPVLPATAINRLAKEYVRGGVHTNSVEGAFSLFKLAVVGSFHQVSHKHLIRYLDEFEFRYNNRKNPCLFRDTITRLIFFADVAL